MAVRAGALVTGNVVLAGRVTDRNGPWVAQQLLAMGVDVANLTVCGDRLADLAAQTLQLPGNCRSVRALSVTVAMHMIALTGQR